MSSTQWVGGQAWHAYTCQSLPQDPSYPISVIWAVVILLCCYFLVVGIVRALNIVFVLWKKFHYNTALLGSKALSPAHMFKDRMLWQLVCHPHVFHDWLREGQVSHFWARWGGRLWTAVSGLNVLRCVLVEAWGHHLVLHRKINQGTSITWWSMAWI